MKTTTKAIPNIPTSFFKTIPGITFVLFLSFLFSCGKAPEVSCSANFIQAGFGARVTYVVGTLNEFQFEVCYNDDFVGSQISVYGVESQSDIATINLASDVRLPHLTDGLRPGDVFSVSFNNDDAWFVIFEDDALGNYDNSTQILKGQFR